jgi:hypothetical protein
MSPEPHLYGVLHKTLPSVSVTVCVSLIVAKQRLGENSPIFARKRLSKNVTAVTNTQATIEELLDASFSMRFVSYQGM